MFTVLLAVAISADLQIAASRTLLASVVTPANQPIVDLEADDFVVREAGQARDILSLRIADYPVIVLIDNSRARDFETIRAAASQFIDRVGQRPVAVGTLAEPPTIVASFDDERSVVLARLNAMKADSAGQGMLLQGIANAARLVSNSGALFSAIVVISAAPVDASRGALNELLGQVLASRAAVHVVANGSGEEISSIDELRGISEQTKGQFTTIYAVASYQIALDHLADQMATEIMVEYIVPTAAAPTGEVMVGVRLPGAVVRGLGVR
jgi:hypothetical protein